MKIAMTIMTFQHFGGPCDAWLLNQAEDEHDDTSNHVDDSDVPIDVLIKNIVADVAPQGYTIGVRGGFQAEADAETFEDKPPAPKLDEGDNADKGCNSSCINYCNLILLFMILQLE